MSLAVGRCTEWRVTLIDGAANTVAVVSTPVLAVAGEFPPDVTAQDRTGAYQAQPNSPIYFRPSDWTSVQVAASAAEGAPVASAMVFEPVPPAGWTGTSAFPVTVSEAPFASNLSPSATADNSTLSVTALDGSGQPSAPRLVALIPDGTGPEVAFAEPTQDGYSADAEATVAWTATDAGSGVREVAIGREHKAPGADGSCLGFDWVPDGVPGAASSPIHATALNDGTCYRWTVTAIDQVGNATTAHSPTILVDTSGPELSFVNPPGAGEVVQEGASGDEISWAETDTGSGIASRSLQRQRAMLVGGDCSDWADDGEPVVDASPVLSLDLEPASCYRMVLTATDRAGNTSTLTSGILQTGSSLLSSPINTGIAFATETLRLSTVDTDIDHVDFLVNGVTVGTTATAPYETTVDTSILQDGEASVAADVVHLGGTHTLTEPVQVTVDNSLSTEGRLDADLRGGLLYVDAWVLNGLFADIAPGGLPARYSSGTPDERGGDLAAAALLGEWDQLGPTTQAAVQDLLDGPIGQYYQPQATIGSQNPDPDFPGCEVKSTGGMAPVHYTECTFDTDHFHLIFTPVPDGDPNENVPTEHLVSRLDIVHYVGPGITSRVESGANGVPDDVDEAAAAAEQAHATYVGWGWTPPADEGSGRRVHLQLDKTCTNTDGLAWPNLMDPLSLAEPGTICMDPHAVVSPDPQNPDGPRERVYHLLIPHEVFHHFQFRAVSSALTKGDSGFWIEGTAQWAERHFELEHSYGATGMEDWTWHIDTYLAKPSAQLAGKSFDAEGRDYAAGSMVAWFLEETFGSHATQPDASGKAVVKSVFDRLAGFPPADANATDAIRDLITDDKHASIAATWLDYAQTLYQMDSRSPYQDHFFRNVENVAGWRASLRAGPGDRGVTKTHADALAKERPASKRMDLAAWSPTPDEPVILGDLGMAFYDLVPADPAASIVVTLDVHSAPIAARLVPYQKGTAIPPAPALVTGPTEDAATCGPSAEWSGQGEPTLSVRTSAACPFATLILVRYAPNGPVWSWDQVATFSVESRPGNIDTFNRPDQAGWGTSDAGLDWIAYIGNASSAIVNGQGAIANPVGTEYSGSCEHLQGTFPAVGMTTDIDVAVHPGSIGDKLEFVVPGVTISVAINGPVQGWPSELGIGLCPEGACGETSGGTSVALPFDATAGGMHHLQVHLDTDTVTASLDGTQVTMDRRNIAANLPPISGSAQLYVCGDTFSGADPIMTVDNLNVTSRP